jgi:photosystem II stability/assembly factor-like uncharacterized protein
VSFTRDEGRTFAPRATALGGIAYTYGLAALDTPGVLLSWHRDTLSSSRDDGCSWTPVGSFVTDFPPRIEPARGGRAYAWSDNRAFFLRYDERGARQLKGPGTVLGIGVDPNDADHVRAGVDDGSILDSTDGGESWTRRGVLTPTTALFYRFAFDPANLDHIVAGTAAGGAWVSFDGGVSWAQAAQQKNIFNVVVSPADPNVVWAMGIDLKDDSRHIYRSTDGGRSYTAVVDGGGGVTLINGPTMAAHPVDPNVLYFVFGTYFQDYGTDLFRYHAGSKSLTMTHSNFDGINAIAFSRRDPRVMYVGLESERRSGDGSQ